MGAAPWVVRGAVVLAVMAAVTVYAITDDVTTSNVCYLGVVLGAGVGAWLGAVRAPRARRLVPCLIAGGLTLSALAEVLWSALDASGADTDVSLADPLWFAGYGLLCAALWVVLHGRAGRRGSDVDLVIDAATIIAVAVLVLWGVSIDTIVADETVSPFVRAVWATYPVADAVLLALVVHVLMSRSARASVAGSFAIGVCLWLAADLAYLVAPYAGSAQLFMDAGWMVAPALLAHAAWQAGRVEPSAPREVADGGWVGQLVLAVGPLAVPASLELAGDLRGEPDKPLQLLLGTAVMMTLAFLRTARLIRSEERAHRHLEEARDAALAASRAKSMFLANVSHEIRTPMTTVLAGAELLEETALDEVQRRLLTNMRRSGALLRTLLESILDFSRIEAGRFVLTTTAFDLHRLVSDTAETYAQRALRDDIGFACHVEPGVPRHVVGDPVRLLQVLTNLLDNAFKFTHHGGVTLRVGLAGAWHRPELGEGDDACVEFTVIDTGIGIREDDLHSVFDSFTQVDGSPTRRYGGSGLGLAICKELSELMRGSLSVQSQFGAGSTFAFRVILPRAEAGVSVPADEDHAVRDGTRADNHLERIPTP